MLAPNLEGTSGEPFDLGRDFGQLLKLRNGQGSGAGGEGEAAGGDINSSLILQIHPERIVPLRDSGFDHCSQFIRHSDRRAARVLPC